MDRVKFVTINRILKVGVNLGFGMTSLMGVDRWQGYSYPIRIGQRSLEFMFPTIFTKINLRLTLRISKEKNSGTKMLDLPGTTSA